MRARRAAGVVVLVLAAGAALAPPALAAAEVGTVETIAGPGYCSERGMPDPSSRAVRALAVDAKGNVHLDAGPPNAGMVASIDPTGRATLMSTGNLAVGQPASAPTASRLAADPTGDVLLVTADRLVRLGKATQVIAGEGADRGPEGPAAGDGDGDGGPVQRARLGRLLSIATDEAGNAYVAEETDARTKGFRVRFVNRTARPVTFYAGTPDEMTVLPGAIDTIVGASAPSGSGSGSGGARHAVLAGTPPALAVAGAKLYIAAAAVVAAGTQRGAVRAVVQLANLGGQAVTAHGRRVPAAGLVEIAGAGTAQPAEGRAAAPAALPYLPGIAAGPDGTLYLADQSEHRVLRVDDQGLLTTVAGTGRAGFNGNDRLAATALLDRPFDVKVGPGGVYISDEGNGLLRVVDAAGFVRNAPGNGSAVAWTCQGGAAERAGRPEQPGRLAAEAVAADGQGNTYYTAGPAIMRVDPRGSISRVAGGLEAAEPCDPGAVCPSLGDGGPAGRARLRSPGALATRPGGLYILDGQRVRFVNLGTHRVRANGVSVRAGRIDTVAGNGTLGFGGDDGPARSARLAPTAIAADAAGRLFIADFGNSRVRDVDATGTIRTVLGPFQPERRDRCCQGPTSVAVDGGGNLYVGDNVSARVWAMNRGPAPLTLHGVTVQPGATEVVAGNGTQGFAGDGGRALDAQVSPMTLAADGHGTLYIAEEANYVVRRVDAAGNITAALGTGQRDFNGDGLKGALTMVAARSVTVDACGNLVATDRFALRVRRLRVATSCAYGTTPARRGRPVAGLVLGIGVFAVSAVVLTAVVVRRRTRARPA